MTAKPHLPTPSMVALIQGAHPGIGLTDTNRDAAIDAMGCDLVAVALDKPTESCEPGFNGKLRIRLREVPC